MAIDKSIKNYRSFSEKVMDRWVAVSVLTVVPRAGRQLNAYYDRRTLSFFFEKDKTKNIDIFAADSPDVTVHELGHAVLDYKRPDFWNTASLEIAAMHESWGDTFSFINQLQYTEVVQAVLQVTNGNLRTPNVISSLAEQMGRTIYNNDHPAGSNPSWLRSAINEFKYVSPQTLPSANSSDKLAAEPHSFSRILTGTFYDLMVAIYETEISNGKDSVVALLDAAKGLGWYLDRAMNRTPNTTQAFTALANTILKVDKEMSGSFYYQKFLSIFKNRQLISDNVQMLSIRESKTIKVRLCEKLNLARVSALNVNPLYDVEIEIPDDGEESFVAAKRFLDYLHSNNKVSSSPDTPFEVTGGKLIRNHFDSDYYIQNWLNPTQPEYYKPPKPQNNFSPCGCREELEKENEKITQKIIREKIVRPIIIK